MTQTRTPLEKFFSTDIAEKLKKLYQIETMEALKALSETGENALKGMADKIGLEEKIFLEIVAKADVLAPRRSERKYPIIK